MPNENQNEPNLYTKLAKDAMEHVNPSVQQGYFYNSTNETKTVVNQIAVQVIVQGASYLKDSAISFFSKSESKPERKLENDEKTYEERLSEERANATYKSYVINFRGEINRYTSWYSEKISRMHEVLESLDNTEKSEMSLQNKINQIISDINYTASFFKDKNYREGKAERILKEYKIKFSCLAKNMLNFSKNSSSNYSNIEAIDINLSKAEEIFLQEDDKKNYTVATLLL